MKSLVLFITLCIVIDNLNPIITQSTTRTTRLQGKPGACPSVNGTFGICISSCNRDQECPGSQKCCSNGCGQVCRNPVGNYSVIPTNSNYNNSRTPLITTNQPSNRSIIINTIPYTPKPGLCPNKTNLVFNCVQNCNSDQTCPGNKKCCYNGCGMTCEDSVPRSNSTKINYQ